MHITSRNVNWIRSVLGKWFYEWLQKDNPDILCIQETKAFETQLPPDFRYYMQDYNMIWHAGTRPGYSWVATFFKKTLNLVDSKSKFESIEHFHEDGRVVETRFEKFTLLNIYFPNGWEKSDGTQMLDYKLDFYDHFIGYINNLRSQWQKIITCWDFNICHHVIDIARPEENKNSIWFLPIERAKMDELQNNKLVDVFRYFNPNTTDEYTWWSYRAWARPRNVWRRLDYFRVSDDIIPYTTKISHQTAIEGSDHCPISLDLDI